MDRRHTNVVSTILLILTVSFLSGTLSPAIAQQFGYDPPDVLPQDWGTIPGRKLCGTGTAQSPIDFSQGKNTPKDMRVKRKKLRDIVYDYQETGLVLSNRRYDVHAAYEPGSTIQLTKKGPLYNLLQFHFHAPAEHTLEHGALFEIEIHLVHQSSADPNQFAVVGVWIKEGKENAALKPVFDHLSKVRDYPSEPFVDAGTRFNIGDALPSDRRYFAYHGSLTTPGDPPGCAEVVEWHVLQQPIEASREQIDALVDVLDNSCCPINGNNRPTQPINGRKIFLDKK